MEVGDIVKVSNWSWSMSLIGGKIRPANGSALTGQCFRVLGVRGVYPTVNSLLETNNILLVDVKDPDFVLFSQERFCSVVTAANPDVIHPSPDTILRVPHGTREIHCTFR